jgi:hypothetical protein
MTTGQELKEILVETIIKIMDEYEKQKGNEGAKVNISVKEHNWKVGDCFINSYDKRMIITANTYYYAIEPKGYSCTARGATSINELMELYPNAQPITKKEFLSCN